MNDMLQITALFALLAVAGLALAITKRKIEMTVPVSFLLGCLAGYGVVLPLILVIRSL
ncbi:hypothetical protein BcepSauron_432 [Burkholderia phage BcepSauron]|uniref:Uncharacterized protein n=2 Tax=Sarumanvirus TaxID=2843450 RepID=A0A482MNL5_9CAUD|nr:hypothetical protein H1O16_gp430 [Burkholderia phage BcepSaruman]YP_009904810.1 hypothetical protein H1O17_gp432 [Burkholderia phage BcepSauron]QBQ74812.1 hypothetical protein BcepSauron_432 [Burkholderia phage BcepSauron]QBX06843.1 hypothetical protein BcepSaruman_430 [Burkholderia phage BcepSaruman]